MGDNMEEWIIGHTAALYAWLVPSFQIGLVLAVLMLLLSIWKRARPFTGTVLFLGSYLFGLTTWLLGTVAALAAYGWPGVLVGLIFVGVGVVPIGIVGAFFKLGLSDLGWSLCTMLAITLVCRFAGMKFTHSLD
jgi:hypothetical protein